MIRIPKWFLGLLVVALVLAFTGVALADDASGKVKSADKEKVVVTDKDGKDWTFVVNKDTKVTVGGKDGKAEDLKKDAEVKVTYKKDKDTMVASEIAAK
jgi:ABC-type Fe3+-hydroxamate transport system substrate-binding protein